MKTLRIGFDLDGVLVDKPPLIPRWFLGWLFKGSCRRLNYHCPPPGWNRKLRIWSHQPWLRPPLKVNIAYVQKLAKQQNTKLFLISSRYSFLAKPTNKLLTRRGLGEVFDRVILNRKNEPPHLFKRRALEKLALNYYFEDDPEMVGYLQKNLPRLKVCLVSRKKSCEACRKTWE